MERWKGEEEGRERNQVQQSGGQRYKKEGWVTRMSGLYREEPMEEGQHGARIYQPDPLYWVGTGGCWESQAARSAVLC